MSVAVISKPNAGHVLLSRDLSLSLGVAIDVGEFEVAGGSFVGARFSDLAYPNGLTFLISDTPKRLTCDVWLDPYAGSLLQEFCATDDEDRNLFQQSRSQIEASGIASRLVINGAVVNANDPLPPAPWLSLEFDASIEVPRGVPERGDKMQAMFTAVCSLFLCLLELAEDDEVPVEDPDLHEMATQALGEVEGRAIATKITRYERSRKNRAACIRHFGNSCQACGIDFGQKYGELGQGYIEVHHRLPVSMMQSAYKLDIVKDLIPVCSNCHRMMHRKWPPVSPEELKSIVSASVDAERAEHDL